jgi:hypothetical protein
MSLNLVQKEGFNMLKRALNQEEQERLKQRLAVEIQRKINVKENRMKIRKYNSGLQSIKGEQ